MAQHRHKRETPARRRIPRAVQVSAPLAVVATLSAVTMGVLAATPAPNQTTDGDLFAAAEVLSFADATAVANRGEVGVSRSQIRTAAKAEAAARREMAADRRERAAERRDRLAMEATRRAVRAADDTLWTTAELNLWTTSAETATQVGLLDAVEKVLVTGRREAGRAEIVVEGDARWVSADYLSADKPETGPTLGGACANGTSAGGAGDNVQKVHAAVCANWPSISTYGTLRGGGGDHPLGKAVDIMVSGDSGWAVAEFVRANAGALGVSYVIFAKNIWSVQRSGEGWRAMSDRGSVTANHLDHVHVSTY